MPRNTGRNRKSGWSPFHERKLIGGSFGKRAPFWTRWCRR